MGTKSNVGLVHPALHLDKDIFVAKPQRSATFWRCACEAVAGLRVYDPGNTRRNR